MSILNSTTRTFQPTFTTHPNMDKTKEQGNKCTKQDKNMNKQQNMVKEPIKFLSYVRFIMIESKLLLS